MATTQGTAIVWGGSVSEMDGFTAAVASGYTFTGEDWAEEKDKVELKDKSGVIKTIYYYNTRKTLSLKCYPSGSNASATSTPLIGEKVTVTAATDSDIAGDWICDSVSKARTSEGVVEFSVGLVSYEGVTPA